MAKLYQAVRIDQTSEPVPTVQQVHSSVGTGWVRFGVRQVYGLAVYGGMYGRCTECTAGGGARWDLCQEVPPLDGVAEGPCSGIRSGDALARAGSGQDKPTGDRRMEPRRLINTYKIRRLVSGWLCLAEYGSPWPPWARVSPASLPSTGPSATGSGEVWPTDRPNLCHPRIDVRQGTV